MKSLTLMLLLGVNSASELDKFSFGKGHKGGHHNKGKHGHGHGQRGNSATGASPPPSVDVDLHNDLDAKCYRSRYFDIPAGQTSQDHYKQIGEAQGRYWGCGKKLSNIEAQLYIDTNPTVQAQVGLKGESALKSARKHFSREGRNEKHNLFLRDANHAPFFCSKEHDVCQCSGTIHWGYESRPDTGEKITSFDTLNDFATLAVDADGDLLSCDAATFGSDPAAGHPKQCFCEPKPDKNQARVCGNEGDTCSCPKGSMVLYGRKESKKVPGAHATYSEARHDSWTGIQLTTQNSIKCDTNTFDGVDPLPGVSKACYCDESRHTSLTQLTTQQ